MTVATLDRDIEAYEKAQADLEARYNGKWVLFYDAKFVDAFESFELVAQEAVRRFGRGPYLIRQVGAPPMTLPASVMFRQAS